MTLQMIYSFQEINTSSRYNRIQWIFHKGRDVTEGKKDQKQKIQVKTFAVPFALGEIKENITITTNPPSKLSKEQLIKQALKFDSQGNISEAANYYQYFLDQGFNDPAINQIVG